MSQIFLLLFSSFLDHYTASSVGWDPVRERDLNSILNQTTDFTDTDLPEIEVCGLTICFFFHDYYDSPK